MKIKINLLLIHFLLLGTPTNVFSTDEETSLSNRELSGRGRSVNYYESPGGRTVQQDFDSVQSRGRTNVRDIGRNNPSDRNRQGPTSQRGRDGVGDKAGKYYSVSQPVMYQTQTNPIYYQTTSNVRPGFEASTIGKGGYSYNIHSTASSTPVQSVYQPNQFQQIVTQPISNQQVVYQPITNVGRVKAPKGQVSMTSTVQGTTVYQGVPVYQSNVMQPNTVTSVMGGTTVSYGRGKDNKGLQGPLVTTTNTGQGTPIYYQTVPINQGKRQKGVQVAGPTLVGGTPGIPVYQGVYGRPNTVTTVVGGTTVYPGNTLVTVPGAKAGKGNKGVATVPVTGNQGVVGIPGYPYQIVDTGKNQKGVVQLVPGGQQVVVGAGKAGKGPKGDPGTILVGGVGGGRPVGGGIVIGGNNVVVGGGNVVVGGGNLAGVPSSLVQGPAVPLPPVPEMALVGTQCTGRPTELTFQLTPGTCAASIPMNNQGSLFKPTVDVLPTDMTSFLVRITGSDGSSLLNGVYSRLSIFKIKNDYIGLPDQVTVQVWNPNGTAMYQEFVFSTSLRIGDKFCSLTVGGCNTPLVGNLIGPVDKGENVVNPNPQCKEVPRIFEFEYTGDSCAVSQNSQGSHFFCTLDKTPISYPANVKITSADMSITYFNGQIASKGVKFSIGDGVNPIGANKMTVTVTKANDTELQQVFTFATNCIVDLYEQDSFGVLKLLNWKSDAPTALPTQFPTSLPTSPPTKMPTALPTSPPTPVPTSPPTAAPTRTPTSMPSSAPSSMPTPCRQTQCIQHACVYQFQLMGRKCEPRFTDQSSQYYECFRDEDVTFPAYVEVTTQDFTGVYFQGTVAQYGLVLASNSGLCTEAMAVRIYADDSKTDLRQWFRFNTDCTTAQTYIGDYYGSLRVVSFLNTLQGNVTGCMFYDQ